MYLLFVTPVGPALGPKPSVAPGPSVTFLLSKMHLYNQDKGKAYSYFGTIAKRYLIISNTKNYKKRIDTLSLSDMGDGGLDNDDYIDYNKTSIYNEPIGDLTVSSPVLTPPDQDELSKFIDLFVEYCSKNIYELFPKETDAQIADAILELFRKRDSLIIFNKKALYIYIREQIDVKTPKITKIADRLNSIYKKGYIFYLENGYIKFQ